jgi:hypothetical protein
MRYQATKESMRKLFTTYYSNNSRGERANFKNVPVKLLEEFKDAFKDEFKFRIRYRGPRAHNVSRGFGKRQSTCLKKDAERFSVYRV